MLNNFLKNFVVFSENGKELLEKSNTYIVGCRRRPKYVNGKVVKGEYDGTTLTIQIDRGQEYANNQFELIVPQYYEEDEVLDKDVNVFIDDAKVYTSSYKGFAEIKVSLHGHIEVISGDLVSGGETITSY